MFILKNTQDEATLQSPEPGDTPPKGVRAILITTCTLVSFFHGSNDGQKGVGPHDGSPYGIYTFALCFK
jgi:PiT family inorganic phosphate transporter